MCRQRIVGKERREGKKRDKEESGQEEERQGREEDERKRRREVVNDLWEPAPLARNALDRVTPWLDQAVARRRARQVSRNRNTTDRHAEDQRSKKERTFRLSHAQEVTNLKLLIFLFVGRTGLDAVISNRMLAWLSTEGEAVHGRGRIDDVVIDDIVQSIVA